MGTLITYSAIAAKLAAKRSHFLKKEDYSLLAEMGTVSEAVDYLRKNPAYEDVFEGTENEELHRARIEELLWHSIFGDFSGLYRFSGSVQRKFLDLYFLHFEAGVMKRCLRDAISGRESELNFKIFEPFFRKHSHLDFTAMTEAKNLEDFLNSIQASPYYSSLKELYDSGVRSLFEFETSLDTLYFIRFWKSLKERLSKEDQKAVTACAGEKIDLLNLEWISRAKRHYRLSADSIMKLLIPVWYRLKKSQAAELANASSADEFNRILKGTRYWKRSFSSSDDRQENPEFHTLFRTLLDAVYKRSVQNHPYSAAALESYFYFKEEEIQNIITAVEGIRYQLGSARILSYLAEST